MYLGEQVSPDRLDILNARGLDEGLKLVGLRNRNVVSMLILTMCSLI